MGQNQTYHYKAAGAFNIAISIYNELNKGFGIVAKGAQTALSLASSSRDASSERMQRLGKLLNFQGGTLDRGWYDALGLDDTDKVLYLLVIPDDNNPPKLDDPSAVRAYYSSVAQQLTAISSSNDQAHSSDTQTMMAATTSDTSGISADANLLQGLLPLFSISIKF